VTTRLGSRLLAAREARRLSQDVVAELLGVSRVLVSYWEHGQRRPSEQILERLAGIYGIPLSVLVDFETPLPGSATVPGADLVALLFRDAHSGIDQAAEAGLRDFVRFLDSYADFLEQLGTPAWALHQSPFSIRKDFLGRDDIRRKAEEVRSWLRLGLGPVGDLAGVLDDAGITVYRIALGEDLKRGVSGAFLNHPRLGMCIAVNLQTTPGRQTFTIAHELAHALFHSQRDSQVVSYWGRKDEKERFADAWAGEFLVPQEGLRRASESVGIKSVTTADEAVHLQRLFGVSYGMMLVRLLQAKLLTLEAYEELREARPVAVASALGYAVHPEEWRQEPARWRLERFPRRFIRALTAALREGRTSPASAAGFTGLTVDEMAELMTPSSWDGDESSAQEHREFEGVRRHIAAA
jgi:Zn-dependent peptidase ImmA (M78 family)/transcriptional regulator with XRE-family HTH domain